MKKRTAVFIVVLALALQSCQALSPQTTPTAVSIPAEISTQAQPQNSNAPLTEADVPRITVSDAKAALDAGQAILVDVRRVESYVERHAEGAVSIPLENFETNIAGLSLEKSQWIITYCT